MTPILRCRDRVTGPELRIEDAVENSFDELFRPVEGTERVAFGSLPIGGGVPDITLVSYRSELVKTPTGNRDPAAVLAYLRRVRIARSTTISNRLRLSEASAQLTIDALLQAGALERNAAAYSMAPAWKDILVNVVAVEAKVSNWRRALGQAVRNLVFCHRSYVALPSPLACRVSSEHGFRTFGIGVMGVDADGNVRVERLARRQYPRAWFYYYALALHLAEHFAQGQQE